MNYPTTNFENSGISLFSDIVNVEMLRANAVHESVSQRYIKQVFLTGSSLALVDAVAMLTSMVVPAQYCVLAGYRAELPQIATVAMVVFAGLALMWWKGLYRAGIHPTYELRQMLLIVGGVAAVSAAQKHIANEACGLVFCTASFAMLLLPLLRSYARSVLVKCDWWGVRCLVFGADRRAVSLYENHQRNRATGLIPVGIVQSELPAECNREVAEHYRGDESNVNALARKFGASCAFLHRRGRTDSQLHQFISDVLKGFPRVVIMADDPRLPVLWSLAGQPGVSIEDNLLKPSSQWLKRMADLIVSGLGLLIGAPLLVGLGSWIWLTSPGPILFGHTRIARNGRRFKAWKFRSMVTNGDAVLKTHLENSPEAKEEWESTRKLRNDPRITMVGRFLRGTSLDELPQLWNVLMGDMSLVGPRPIVDAEVARYDDTFTDYVRVRPGVTGLWQVSGRNLTTYGRRVELDGYYVRNWSVWLDLYILCRTVKTVALREGAF